MVWTDTILGLKGPVIFLSPKIAWKFSSLNKILAMAKRMYRTAPEVADRIYVEKCFRYALIVFPVIVHIFDLLNFNLINELPKSI